MYPYSRPLIRCGYPLLDDPPAHEARAAKRRWLLVLSTPGRKRVPRLSKALAKKHSAHFFLCTVFLHRTHNETHSQTQRNPPVIYFTKAAHSASSIHLKNQPEHTFIDANTRDKLPEASPKGPGPTHFRALAGQRLKNNTHTLVPQGLASRSPNRKKNQISPENKNYLKQQMKTQSHTCIPQKKTVFRYPELLSQDIHKKRRRPPYAPDGILQAPGLLSKSEPA